MAVCTPGSSSESQERDQLTPLPSPLPCLPGTGIVYAPDFLFSVYWHFTEISEIRKPGGVAHISLGFLVNSRRLLLGPGA